AGVGSQTGLTPRNKTGDTPPPGSASSGAEAPTAPLPPPNLQTPAGLQPPPDNSFDRRADFANAHRARRSTQAGFRETPQAGYVAKGSTELNPELAQALGYNESDPSKPLIGVMPDERDEISDISEPRREKRHRPSLQPVTLGVGASMQALDKLLREGRPEFAAPDGVNKIWTPHRPPRPEKSEGGLRLVIKSEFEPAGDQPLAIKELIDGVRRHDRMQVLLGVTGSGKTFTMAQ